MDLVVFLPLLIILGAFMFFASRRQKKAMQATIDLHNSLRIGDRVHTTSGLEATIAGVTDDTVDLEIAPGVVTTWMKLAIRDVIGSDDRRRRGRRRRRRARVDRDGNHRQPDHPNRLTPTTDSQGLSTGTYPLRC